MCYENRTLRILLGFHANCFGCCNPAVDYEDVIMRLSIQMNITLNENTDMMFIRINIKHNIMITFTNTSCYIFNYKELKFRLW